MRVRSWVIDGVEALPRLESGELPNGLIVVYSDDVDRKDAAVAVIRRLLFSAPGSGAGRSTAHLSGSNGDFELSTNGSAESETFCRADGAPAGREDLGRLFGDAERSNLQPVFDVDVNGADAPLIDAALPSATSAVLPPGLDLRMRTLIGPDGDGTLDRLLAELEDIESRLAAALENEASYRDQLAAERTSTDEVGRICAELADLRKRRERLKAYAALWPAWLKRVRVEKDLAELEEIDDFPDTDVSIVEAQQHAHTAELELKSLRKQHRQARAELEAHPEPGARHAILESVAEIHAELPAYRKQMTAFARARARHDELARVLPEIAHRVSGEQGDAAPCDPMRLDLAATREWLNRSDSLAEREAVTRASLEKTRASLKQLRNERQRAVRAAKTLSVQLDDSDEHWRALWSLRDDLEQLWEIQSQGEAAARSAEQRQSALESLDRRRYRVPSPAIERLLWIIVAIALSAALWKTRQEDQVTAVLLCAVVVAAVIGVLVLIWRRRWADVQNRDIVASEERLRYDFERARQVRDARWKSADEIAHRIESAAVALGLSRVPTVEEVDDAEEKLFEASRKLQQRGPLAETALAIHDHHEEEELFMAQLRDIRQAKDATALEWEEWKSSVGLPADLEQEDLTTYMCEYDRWRELDGETIRIDEELRELAPTIEAWESKARTLLRDVGVDIDDSLCGRDLEDQLTMLRDSATRSRRLLAKQENLKQKVADLEEQLDVAESAASEHTAVFEDLRRRAGTEDETEFARRKQIFHHRRELNQTLAQLEDDFVALLGQHHLADDSEVRADLSHGNADAWTEQGYDIDTEIDRLEAAMETASHERSTAAAACREIEQSGTVTALQQERACLREEIRRRADDWRRLSLAAGLIEEAAKSLSETGSVLSDASASLRKLTLGEMVRLVAPDGSEHLVVVDRRGEQHKVNGNLSAELTRQIKLSLQLSMVRDIARGRGPIPVVMDEVMQDLADDKSAATAAEIAALAEQQQVFYFTTDESSIAKLEAAGDVSRVLRV